MKKQQYKERILNIELQCELAIRGLASVSRRLIDTEEALTRRRILYDRLINHSTNKEPKSMRDMAESLYCTFADKTPPDILQFKELSQKEQDEWMDRLLTILN